MTGSPYYNNCSYCQLRYQLQIEPFTLLVHNNYHYLMFILTLLPIQISLPTRAIHMTSSPYYNNCSYCQLRYQLQIEPFTLLVHNNYHYLMFILTLLPIQISLPTRAIHMTCSPSYSNVCRCLDVSRSSSVSLCSARGPSHIQTVVFPGSCCKNNMSIVTLTY